MRTIRYFWIVLLLSFSLSISIQAQGEALSKEIRKSMTSSEQKKYDKAQNLLKEGDKLYVEGMTAYAKVKTLRADADAQSNKSRKRKLEKTANKLETKASQTLVKSSKKYEIANKLLYSIYTKGLKKLQANTTEGKKAASATLIALAGDNFKEAKNRRSNALRVNNTIKAYEILQVADKKEKQAMTNLEQAYGILFLTKDVVENTQKKETIQVENKTEPVTKKIETKTQSTETTNTTETTKTEKQQTTQTQSTNTQATNKSTTQTHRQTGVKFRIQIYANKKDPGHEYIQKHIYKQDLGADFFITSTHTVNGVLWHTYFAPLEYKTYEKAYNEKRRLNIKGAFIVATKNGERIENINSIIKFNELPKHIQDALNKEYSNQGSNSSGSEFQFLPDYGGNK